MSTRQSKRSRPSTRQSKIPPTEVKKTVKTIKTPNKTVNKTDKTVNNTFTESRQNCGVAARERTRDRRSGADKTVNTVKTLNKTDT